MHLYGYYIIEGTICFSIPHLRTYNRKIKDDKLKRKSLFYDLNHIRELCLTLKGTYIQYYIVLLVPLYALTMSVKNKILYEKQAGHSYIDIVLLQPQKICAKSVNASVQRTGHNSCQLYSMFNTSFFIILLYYHEKRDDKVHKHEQKNLWEILRNVCVHSDCSKEAKL